MFKYKLLYEVVLTSIAGIKKASVQHIVNDNHTQRAPLCPECVHRMLLHYDNCRKHTKQVKLNAKNILNVLCVSALSQYSLMLAQKRNTREKI